MSSIPTNSSDRCIEWDKSSSFLSPQLGIQITLVQEGGHLEGKVQYVSRGVFYKLLAGLCEALGLGNGVKNWGAKPITNIAETIGDIDTTENWIGKVGEKVRDYLESSKTHIDLTNRQTLQKVANLVDPLLQTKRSAQALSDQAATEEKPSKPSLIIEEPSPTVNIPAEAEQEKVSPTTTSTPTLPSILTELTESTPAYQESATGSKPGIGLENRNIVDLTPLIKSEADPLEDRIETVGSSITLSTPFPSPEISEIPKTASPAPIQSLREKTKPQAHYFCTAKKVLALFALIGVSALVGGWRMGLEQPPLKLELNGQLKQTPVPHNDYFNVCRPAPFMFLQQPEVDMLKEVTQKTERRVQETPAAGADSGISTPTDKHRRDEEIATPEVTAEAGSVQVPETSSQAKIEELSKHLANVLYNFISYKSWLLIVQKHGGPSDFHYSDTPPPKILERQKLRIKEALKSHFSEQINPAYTWKGRKEWIISCTDYNAHRWLADIFKHEGIDLSILNLPPKLDFTVSPLSLSLEIKMEFGGRKIKDTMHFLPSPEQTTQSIPENLYGAQTPEDSIAFANSCLALVNKEIERLNALYQPIVDEQTTLADKSEENQKRLKELKWQEKQIKKLLNEQRDLETCIKGAISGNPEAQNQYANLIAQNKWGNEPGFESFWSIEAETQGFTGKDVSQRNSLQETSSSDTTVLPKPEIAAQPEVSPAKESKSSRVIPQQFASVAGKSPIQLPLAGSIVEREGSNQEEQSHETQSQAQAESINSSGGTSKAPPKKRSYDAAASDAAVKEAFKHIVSHERVYHVLEKIILNTELMPRSDSGMPMLSVPSITKYVGESLRYCDFTERHFDFAIREMVRKGSIYGFAHDYGVRYIFRDAAELDKFRVKGENNIIDIPSNLHVRRAKLFTKDNIQDLHENYSDIAQDLWDDVKGSGSPSEKFPYIDKDTGLLNLDRNNKVVDDIMKILLKRPKGNKGAIKVPKALEEKGGELGLFTSDMLKKNNIRKFIGNASRFVRCALKKLLDQGLVYGVANTASGRSVTYFILVNQGDDRGDFLHPGENRNIHDTHKMTLYTQENLAEFSEDDFNDLDNLTWNDLSS